MESNSAIDTGGSVVTTQSTCNCIVCVLIEKGLSTFCREEQVNVIEKGRTKPPMKNLVLKIKKYTRHFNPEKFYEQYEWLTGCETKCKLYCWPCLLFIDEKCIWNKTGVHDLNNLHKLGKKHVWSRTHLLALIKEKMFGAKRVGQTIDKELQALNHRRHNELVDKNREMLKRLIDVVCFLSQHDLGSEIPEVISTKTGTMSYFQDIASLIAKYDVSLENHLNLSYRCHKPPNNIQDDLILAVAAVVLKGIKSEIKQTRFIAVILDETTRLSQLSVVVRYVKKDGIVQERFLGFMDLKEERTADILHEIVRDITNDLKCVKKLVAYSYNGPSVAGVQLASLQEKLRATFPRALFVHSASHGVNVVLSHSLLHIQECRMFFATLNGLSDFFSKPGSFYFQIEQSLPGEAKVLSALSWQYNGKLVLTVYENRGCLIKVLENILINSENWDSEIINACRGFLYCLQRDFCFNFLLTVFSEIFPYCDNIFNIYQNKVYNVARCVKKIEEFKAVVNQKKLGFGRFWTRTIDKNVKPDRKGSNIDDDDVKSYRSLLDEIINQISQQMKHHFINITNLKFFELCNFSAYKGKKFPEAAFVSVISVFDLVPLSSQLKALYETDDIKTKDNASEVLTFLKETGLEKAYSEVARLYDLVLTIPVTNASLESGAESNVSTHQRVKSFLKKSTATRLSQAAILSIENSLVKEMSAHPRFYEDVTEEFAKIYTRIQLHYKERSDFVLGDSIVKWIEPYPELIIKNGAIFCTVCLKNINTDNKHKLANHMRTAQHLARKLDLEQGTHHDGSGSNTSQADPDHDLDECSAISDSQSPSTLDAQPAATEDDAMLIGNIKEECDDTFEEIVEEMLPVTKEELVDILNPLQPSATIESTNVVGPKEESCSEDVESPTLSEPPPKRSRLENVEINGDTPGSSNKCSKDPTQKFYDKINDHLTQKIQDDRELVGIIDSSGNLDLFFQSMAALAKTLSPLDQILLQKNVADVVFQMKVAQLTKKNMSSGTKSSGTEFK